MPGTLPDVSWGGCGCAIFETGPGQVVVPDVVGGSQATAIASIENAGLVVGSITNASHATIPAGNVISQDPAAGVFLDAGSSVNLVISTGPAAVTRTVYWGKSPDPDLASITSLSETSPETDRQRDYLFPAAAGQNYLYIAIPIEFGGPTYPNGFVITGSLAASIARSNSAAPFGTTELNGYWYKEGTVDSQTYRIYRASLTTAGAPTWTVS